MDATHKTTKYDLPLFFLCVRTNTRYIIVAEFIVQSESAYSILEAIKIIRQWNPMWKPNFFFVIILTQKLQQLSKHFLVYLFTCVIFTANRPGHDGSMIESMVFPIVMQRHFFPCLEHVLGLHLERMESRETITINSTLIP